MVKNRLKSRLEFSEETINLKLDAVILIQTHWRHYQQITQNKQKAHQFHIEEQVELDLINDLF